MINYCIVIYIYLLENYRLINFLYFGKISLSFEVIKKLIMVLCILKLCRILNVFILDRG